MAKADLQLVIPVAPLAAFHMVGSAMKASGVDPFAQEGWSLKGQEGMGLFKMGWPCTVIATIGEDGRGGSTIALNAENFGFALNRVHAENLLRKIAEAIQGAAGRMPPMPAAPNTVVPTEDDPNLPPRVS